MRRTVATLGGAAGQKYRRARGAGERLHVAQAAVAQHGSDEPDNLPLRRAVTLDVALRCAETCVPGQLLYVAE